MTMLSVIIVNWNVKELLKQCLDSIFREVIESDCEVIVVDNHSTDGSVEMVRLRFPQVKLIANQENIGYGRAANQAAKIASGDLLFVLNPDTVVKGDTLLEIKEFMEQNPRVGVGGCFVFCPDGKPQDCFFRFPTLANSFSKNFSLFRVLPRTRFTASLFDSISVSNGQMPESVSGSAMVIRKLAFEQVGGFNENYFLYYEETDLCYRIRQKGWKIAAIPKTKVIHLLQQSARKNFSVSVFHAFRSEFLFFEKNYPKYRLPALRLLQLLGIIFRTGYWFSYTLFSNNNAEAQTKLKGYLSLLLADYRYDKTILKP